MVGTTNHVEKSFTITIQKLKNGLYIIDDMLDTIC